MSIQITGFTPSLSDSPIHMVTRLISAVRGIIARHTPFERYVFRISHFRKNSLRIFECTPVCNQPTRIMSLRTSIGKSHNLARFICECLYKCSQADIDTRLSVAVDIMRARQSDEKLPPLPPTETTGLGVGSSIIKGHELGEKRRHRSHNLVQQLADKPKGFLMHAIDAPLIAEPAPKLTPFRDQCSTRST